MSDAKVTPLIRSASKRSSIELPRKLKASTTSSSTSKLSAFESASVGNVLSLLENVAFNLNNGTYDNVVLVAVENLSASLKSWGPHLEENHKDSLDKFQVALRTACRDERMDLTARLSLLEIIELRAMNWKATDSFTNYYKKKLAQIKSEKPSVRPPMVRSTSFHIGAVTKKPPASPSIVSSASGNVVKESVSNKVREIVIVGNKRIELCSDDLNLVKIAKVVLQNYFNAESKNDFNNNAGVKEDAVKNDNESFPLNSPAKQRNSRDVVRYDRETLLRLSATSLSRSAPDGWEAIRAFFPVIAKPMAKECSLLSKIEDSSFVFSGQCEDKGNDSRA